MTNKKTLAQAMAIVMENYDEDTGYAMMMSHAGIFILAKDKRLIDEKTVYDFADGGWRMADGGWEGLFLRRSEMM